MSDPITLTIYDNEDAVRTLTLPLSKLPPGCGDGPPINLTYYTLESAVIDLKTREELLRLDDLISVTDAAAGEFTITIPHGSIAAGARAAFDVLIKHRETGMLSRVLAGTIVIQHGQTTPE